MGNSLRSIMSGIETNLQQMVGRANAMQAYLNRVLYRQYQNAQRTRWQTENVSEGERWEPLNKGYAKRKLTAFASYPGGGRKMMIATNRLFRSVVGPGEDHRKDATSKSLTVAWSTPYGPKTDSERPYTEFGKKTMQEMYDGLSKFIISGILRDLK